MSSPANSVPATEKDSLLSLAKRLPEAQDREQYAQLVSYIDSLSPDDELVKIAKLFGFVTLMGHELPDAIAAEQNKMRDFLVKAYKALEQEVKTNASYHEKLNERLSKLPEEIAEGVQPAAIAKTMGESFRQQLAKTGLEETARVLNSSVQQLNAVAVELARTVKPLEEQYNGIGSRIAVNARELNQAADQLRQRADQLVWQINRERWGWYAGAGAFILLVGVILGLFWEKGSSARIEQLQYRIEQLQQTIKPAPVAPPPATGKRSKKKLIP